MKLINIFWTKLQDYVSHVQLAIAWIALRLINVISAIKQKTSAMILPPLTRRCVEHVK